PATRLNEFAFKCFGDCVSAQSSLVRQLFDGVFRFQVIDDRAMQGFPRDLRLLRLDFIFWWLVDAHLGQVVSCSLFALYFFAQESRHITLRMNMVAAEESPAISAWVFRLLENCVLMQC